jgi:hypothetical protein
MSAEEVFATTPTEDEARLAYARSCGALSWADLISQPGWEDSPGADSEMEALKAGDLDALKRIVAEHAEILHLPAANRWSLPRSVLALERELGRDAMRPFVDWLTSVGVDFQRELDRTLCYPSHRFRPIEDVQWLLDRGANPSWVAPNGIPVLEHLLVVSWIPGAVDLVAARTRPRRALWIAAGLGDVEGVRDSLDAHGRPRPEAVALRPPFDAVGHPAASHPEPDDEELLVEALYIAVLQRRLGVIEYLASRGVPLDSRVYGAPILNGAVGNGWTDVAETLIRSGASVDIRGEQPDRTARELVRGWLKTLPNDPARLRILELCDLAPGPGRQ